jgi:hypothetical protein
MLEGLQSFDPEAAHPQSPPPVRTARRVDDASVAARVADDDAAEERLPESPTR